MEKAALLKAIEETIPTIPTDPDDPGIATVPYEDATVASLTCELRFAQGVSGLLALHHATDAWRCVGCGTSTTPKRRARNTLCNACGLKKRKRAVSFAPHVRVASVDRELPPDYWAKKTRDLDGRIDAERMRKRLARGNDGAKHVHRTRTDAPVHDAAERARRAACAISAKNAIAAAHELIREASGLCVKCENPAQFTCPGCGDGCYNTYYCSRACQAAHWIEHRRDCEWSRSLRQKLMHE